jgi:hypothetical protein
MHVNFYLDSPWFHKIRALGKPWPDHCGSCESEEFWLWTLVSLMVQS